MEKNWTVYKHIFPNGKVYIGITSKQPEKRWNNGYGYLSKKDGKYIQPPMAHAIIQYGWLNVTHEIIASGLSKKEAGEMEHTLVSKYKSNDEKFGYNMTDGGFNYLTPAQVKHKEATSIKTKCNETGIVYSSMNEASKQTGVCISSVRKSCITGAVYHGLSFSIACDEILEKSNG